MINIEDFFKLINLDLSKELIQLNLNFRKNPSLFEKAKNNIYRYIPENEKTHCVFTVFDIPELSDDEVYEIREYIWNENKSDLLFLHHQNKLDLIYSFSDPSSPPIIIDTFSGNEEDNVLIEKIGKSNFDTGLFWEIYYDVREVIRKERVTVDRSLIKTLQILRQKLQTIYNDIISDVDKRDEIIQALIDRTLFIKFMEDKHIINSFFYNHYFENGDNYISFLRSNKKNELNNLFSLINNIFNNTLFENPYIPNKHLVNPALSIIADALERKNLETGQLSLFGYHFDVIPNEFIGHVYEMFFDESQSEEGIFYTPRGLAKLIVDETIEMTGKVLDPSCGSGVFLVLALKKLFENENLLYNVSVEDISKRNKILAENIYGIEKQANARRLTILSLYLELLDGVDPNELEEYINNKIELGEDFKIFPYDFTSNILHGNALSISSINGVENFEYIIGNPPFLEIKTGEEEEDFWKKHSDKISNKQLSQCFFIKMHEWSCQNTKFGFLSNLSNFDSDSSIKFQLYFYEKYSISQFFNLAEIKSILFENANESTAVIIFNEYSHYYLKSIIFVKKTAQWH